MKTNLICSGTDNILLHHIINTGGIIYDYNYTTEYSIYRHIAKRFFFIYLLFLLSL
jgi:hypothetical protein